MFSIVMEWKTYRVHLGILHTWLLENAGDAYKGASADTVLTLWFETEPSFAVSESIKEHWDSLTEETELEKILLDENRQKAKEAAKQSLLTASFDDLIPAERKLWMNVTLTTEDLDALLVKYPQ